MEDAAGDEQALAGKERHRTALEVEEEPALDHEEELVLAIVLVPLELPLGDADPRDAVAADLPRVDEFERPEPDVRVDRVGRGVLR